MDAEEGITLWRGEALTCLRWKHIGTEEVKVVLNAIRRTIQHVFAVF